VNRRHTSRRCTAAVAIAIVAGCSTNGGGVTEPLSSLSTAPPASNPIAPTTSLSPTSISTTPTDPLIEQAVKQAVSDFFAAYMACGQAPATCHAADFHSERGTAVGQGTVYFNGLAKRGEYFDADLRGSYIVAQSVALEDPTSAIVFSCWYDASILLGPPDTPGGPPKVLNDKTLSVRQKQALYFDGKEWRVGEAATVEDLGDGNHCPPP
jgi:hypothetical protein